VSAALLLASPRASGQSAMADSLRLATDVYAVCARMAEPTLRAVVRYRAHLGTWPIEDDELRTFLKSNSLALPTPDLCSVSGDVDGCVVAVRLPNGTVERMLLPDSSVVRQAEARFYLIAETNAGAVRTAITGELLGGRVESRDGRQTLIPAYAPAAARILQASRTAPDSVLFLP
jgi:hypothetical protein